MWQLSFDLGRHDPDAVEALCREAGACSVTFMDALDDPVLEPLPGEFRLWPSTRLRVLFDVDDPAAAAAALSCGLNLGPGMVAVERVEERAWEREWLADFHAMRFGRRLWVCPRHESVPDPDAVVVWMDPGLAFGTGTHPTTRICLEWLDGHLAPGQRIIDFGCGSGILALAGVALGAASAHCFDIDAQALIATADNARTNALQSRIHIVERADALPVGVDVLVANILAGPLRQLAPQLQKLVRPGGSIVLAGLLQDDVRDVTQAYSTWFDITPFAIREDWAGLSGKRHVTEEDGARRTE